MKEIFRFIKWQWQKFETWQKLWIIGAWFFGASLTANEPLKIYLLAVPIFILFFFQPNGSFGNLW